MKTHKNENPNADIIEYLQYYCDPRKPFDFAVMLKGSWGAGKTYLIKEFVKELKASSSDIKALYVSLYGVTSFRQIDDQLFRQLHPVLSSRGAKIAASVAKGLLKSTLKIDIDEDKEVDIDSKIPDVNIRDYIVSPHSCILIFDDLERCSMPIDEALGYINSFVEHEDCKAIILANEEEILRTEDADKKQACDFRYKEIKEKLVGRTLKVKAQTKAALENFLDLITTKKVKNFLEKNADNVLLLHNQSATNNLRVLKQSLWTFERLANCFSEAHWKSEEATQNIMNSVLSLSFEIQSGNFLKEICTH